MRRIPSITLTFIFTILLVLTGCNPGSKSSFPDHLMLIFTGQNRGTMAPCGCHVPVGGLTRLGGVIASWKSAARYDSIVLDAGSFSSGNTGYEIFNATWILKAYKEIGYHAVNIGWFESLMPVKKIRELDAASGNMLISANLIDADGLPVTRKFLIREIGGLKFGITGIVRTSPNNPSADLNRDETEMPKFLKASDALQEVMAEFKKQNVDFVILLADTDTDVIDTVLESVDGIDLVVHSQIFFNKSTPIGPKLVNDSTRIVQIGGNGELVGRLRLDFQPDGAIIDEETMLAELDPSVPVDGAIAKILYEYKLELRKNRDEYMTDPGTPFARYISPDLTDLLSGYTGINICISCHQQYAIDVQLVGHRDAWRRLPTENLQDPNCLPCHTTGWGVPTGLANPYRDTHLTGVTCEACHGPGADHARDMYKAKGEYDPEYALPEENPTGLEFSRYVPRDVCIRCHTPEWSPNFDYETWVPRVNHSIIGERQREPQDGTQWTPPPEPPE